MQNKTVPQILLLIQAQEWIKLKRTLKIDSIRNRSSVARCSSPCSATCESTHSALHSACQFHPPLDVIKMLYKAHPAAIYEYDCKGRSALHIACGHGCSPEVIKFLLDENPEATKKKDAENRTPYLTALKSYVAESKKERKEANEDLLEVARELYNVYPAASIKVNERIANGGIHNRRFSRRHSVDKLQSMLGDDSLCLSSVAEVRPRSKSSGDAVVPKRYRRFSSSKISTRKLRDLLGEEVSFEMSENKRQSKRVSWSSLSFNQNNEILSIFTVAGTA